MNNNLAIKLALKLPFIGYRLRQAHYDLLTETGEELLAGNEEAWQEYPRPQLKRDGYQILNGTWTLDGEKIRMPFPPQAFLSGFQGKVGNQLTYEKKFKLPDSFTKERVLLHFGAVDQIAAVYVNGKEVGYHEGGYLPFSCDITDAVLKEENTLVVKVTDTLSHDYPYGKQKKKRGGMWYTPVSGIWQTVWLENVPAQYITDVKLTPDLSGVDIEVHVSKSAQAAAVSKDAVFVSEKEEYNAGEEKEGFTVELILENGQRVQKKFEGGHGRLELSQITLEDGSAYQPILWTPENPHLYSLRIMTKTDAVKSYFALRTINIEEKGGKQRVCLNGEPIFLHGVLDQGYYSDGIYLPAKPEEYEKDIQRMKELGINFLRKHIKVEPEYFYYACDRMGMLVMQDMVNNGPYSFLFDTALPTIGMKKRKDTKGSIQGKRKEIFIKHSKETISHLYNHPSIIAYTIFNEGWGQFHSDTLYDLVKEWDPTRVVDSTSGWFAQKKNDFDSEHIYFKVIPLLPKKRPLFVSECGGYSMAAAGHMYSRYASYGYGTCEDGDALTKEIANMYEKMILPYIKDGVCGCIYTQLSDVEDEINGLYTYDRKVCKVNKETMKKLADIAKSGTLVDNTRM